jgi:hypothetical protein
MAQFPFLLPLLSSFVDPLCQSLYPLNPFLLTWNPSFEWCCPVHPDPRLLVNWTPPPHPFPSLPIPNSHRPRSIVRPTKTTSWSRLHMVRNNNNNRWLATGAAGSLLAPLARYWCRWLATGSAAGSLLARRWLATGLPLARYWLKPCCDNPDHHTNYSSSSYLPNLGASVFRLREFIRDSLFTKRSSNFRVICPNRMLGLGPMLDDQKANEISDLWGRDAVHPLPAAYEAIAGVLDKDISDDGARYINPPRASSGPPSKKQRIDESKLRQGWVDGCSAALPRRDNFATQSVQHSRHRRGGGRGRGGGSHKPRPWTKFGRGGGGSRGRGGGAGGMGR